MREKQKIQIKKDMSKKFVIVQCTSNYKGATLRQRHIWILKSSLKCCVADKGTFH